MHVLYVGNAFDTDPQAGGTEGLTADLARALSSRSVRITWLAAGRAPRREPVDGVRRVAVPAFPAAAPPIVWRGRERRHRQAVATVLRRLPRPDVVHVMHFSRLGLGVLAARPLGMLPVVATLTDYTAVCADFQMVHRGTQWPCQAPVPAADCAACLAHPGLPPAGLPNGVEAWRRRNLHILNSRCEALWLQTPHQRTVLKRAGLDGHNVVRDRAAYAIPANWRVADTTREGAPTLLFLGRAAPDKGMDVLLEAFAGWRRPARLRVVTVSDDLGYERRLRTAASGDPRIDWLPPVPRDDLDQVFRGVSGLVVPSQWHDNHPTVLQYARALGVPVLCSAVPSLTHLRGDRGIRFVEHYTDPGSWTAAFDDLVEHPPPRSALIAQFRREYDEFIDETMDAYRKLVGR